MCKVKSVQELTTQFQELNPLHLNIMHILHTVLYTFPRFQQGEFVKPSRALLVAYHFLYSHDLNLLFRGDIVRRN